MALAKAPTPQQWQRATIPQALRRAATLWPQAHALEDGAAVYTFAQLDEAAAAAARAFMAAGVARGERVAIWAPNIHEWVVAALGALKAGATFAGLNFRWKAGEAAAALHRIEARALCTLGACTESGEHKNPAEAIAARAGECPKLQEIIVLRGQSAEGITWPEFLRRSESVAPEVARAREAEVAADDVADLIFTSGTTGAPKAVMATHGQNLRTFDAWSRGVGMREGERELIIPPFSHSFGSKAGWLACLLRGACALPQRDFAPKALLQRIAESRVSMWPGVPAMYQAVLALPEFADADLSCLRLAVTGGGAVPVELVRQMKRQLGLETVITAYGLTESTGCVTMCLPTDAPETIATTCGRAMPGVEVKCVDNQGAEVAPGEAGEVWVRGYNVMKGYWNAPEQSAAAVDADGWLHTGDIGVMDARGYLRITDRLKDMYIVNGFNVYPAEVENQLYAVKGIVQVAVVGIPDEKAGESGVAFVVPRAGADSAALETEIRNWCRENMAGYKTPRQFRFVSELPLNATGKVDKLKLRAAAAAAAAQ